jgi:hypothetical protein
MFRESFGRRLHLSILCPVFCQPEVQMSSKSIELRFAEGAALIRQLEAALARQRGGGTPITSMEYLALRKDALDWLEQNEPK